jgi:CBS domain-containing protein
MTMQLGTRDRLVMQGGDEGVVVTKGGSAAAWSGGGGTEAAWSGGGWDGVRSLTKRSRVPRGLEQTVQAEPSVMDLMGDPPPIAPAHLKMAAARKIAQLKGADMLLVEDDSGRILGVVDGYTLQGADDNALVSDGMKPVCPCVRPDSSAHRARDLLARHSLPALLVIVGRFVVGVVSRAAIERALAGDRRAAHAPAHAQSWAA